MDSKTPAGRPRAHPSRAAGRGTGRRGRHLLDREATRREDRAAPEWPERPSPSSPPWPPPPAWDRGCEPRPYWVRSCCRGGGRWQRSRPVRALNRVVLPLLVKPTIPSRAMPSLWQLRHLLRRSCIQRGPQPGRACRLTDLWTTCRDRCRLLGDGGGGPGRHPAPGGPVVAPPRVGGGHQCHFRESGLSPRASPPVWRFGPPLISTKPPREPPWWPWRFPPMAFER